MKKISIIAGLMLCGAVGIYAQEFNYALLNATLQADSSKKSVKTRSAIRWMSDSLIITHHSPAVKGRTIWGGLVPYDEVWVSGAHMATSIELPDDIILNGNKVPRGKYALFTIPQKDQDWTFIINKNWNQHLADEYDPKDDVLRLQVKPITLSQPVERLQWIFDRGPICQHVLWLVWADKAIAIPARDPVPCVPARPY